MKVRRLLLTAILLMPAPAIAQEDPKDIVADQLRAQGYECTNPQSAEADTAASRPDERAWILKCDNATYRVRLIPDMAAEVEKLD